MEEIRSYVAKKYGLILTDTEIKEVMAWFNDNKSILDNEDIADSKFEEFIHLRFKGRTRLMFEQDLSSLKMLLALLEEKTRGK